MSKKGKLLIPLISTSFLSNEFDIWEKEKRDWTSFPHIEVAPGSDLSNESYGVRIEDVAMSPVLKPGMVGVFSSGQNHQKTLMDIFFFGIKDEKPRIRKLVKNETGKGKTVYKRRVARKSFMTPTPLHIPGSHVSPIADSTHQMIYLKSFVESETMTFLPAEKLLWMHPLILILKPDQFRIRS